MPKPSAQGSSSSTWEVAGQTGATKAFACLLADGLLVVAFPYHEGHRSSVVTVDVSGDRGATTTQARALVLAAVGQAPRPSAGLLVVTCALALTGLEEHGRLEVRVGSQPPHALAFDEDLFDVRAWLSQTGLAGLRTPDRNLIGKFLLETPAAHGVTMTPTLSRNLALVRDAIRERLPSCVVTEHTSQGIAVEVLASVSDQAFYVRGWAHDAESLLTRFTIVSPEGARVELQPRLFRYPRADVDAFYRLPADRPGRHGFASYFELPLPNHRDQGWVVELGNDAGSESETTCPVPERKPGVVRNVLVGDLVLERLPDERLRLEHISPAISRLLDGQRATTEIVTVDQWGRPPDDPAASVVVPLYGRIDFLEHQLAQFVHDADMADVDLIYVLDSPELADALHDSALRLHRLYRMPFRTVTLNRNSGFSTANNMGASLAEGRLLLLLNSDVVPEAPGWLPGLVKFHDDLPDAGAVGPMLLFEDDSIQHAGMYFDRPDGAALWGNEHYFKGLHRSFAPANVSRPVPAVTAACLLIDAGRYRDLEGLRGIYVQGDFEDSDLCLRLRAEGLRTWYTAETRLYHLEGQSYPTPLRALNGAYNSWLHTSLWNDTITDVMAQHALHPTSHHAGAQA